MSSNASRPSVDTSLPTISSEAIVVVDVVESTLTSNLFGWYAVGRNLMRTLRQAIRAIGIHHNLICMKSTGDGYLLTYGNSQSAELSVLQALGASLQLVRQLAQHNDLSSTAEEQKINVRIAIHFGQVDVIENDREGPDVSYAFRLEGIDRESLKDAIDGVPSQQLPLQNYIICSEPVRDIVMRHSYPRDLIRLGLFRLKGFHDWHEVFLVSEDETSNGATANGHE